ncbi:MAG: hypothetical protein GY793_08700 [Proteobacteria bacterium]|nr:hypothetical protein [Pseudomonadota bacterium]
MTNSIDRMISCDIITVVSNYKDFVDMLSKQGSRTQWLRHNIIAILNMSDQDAQSLESWYYDARVNHPMPEVTMIKAKKDHKGDLSAMHNAGILAGHNPFIYIHNENDDLPSNIDKTIFKLYNDKNLQACFARTETFLDNRTPLEKFPLLNPDGEFKYDCLEATKLFPSYIDPLSAIFKRSIFDKIPYWDMEFQFKGFAYYHFILKLLENTSYKVEFLPYTIKIAKRKNISAGNISAGLRNNLVHDIKLWLPEHPEDKYKDFQQDILHLIEEGQIITFKEIDARIEDYLEQQK